MKTRILRRISQFLGAILANAHFTAWDGDPQIYQGKVKGFVAPILNCYACPSAVVSCPAGSAQHFAALRAIPFYVLGLVGGIALLLGKATCGWVCPFGLLQDLLYKLGRKLKFPKIKLPRWFRYGRYIILVGLVIIAPIATSNVEVFVDPDTGEEFSFVEPGETWFCKLCPAGALEGGIPQVLIHPELRKLLGWLFSTKMIILGLFIISFLFMKRPFCRAACPVGAFLGLFNYVSLLQLKIDTEACTQCMLCYYDCPVEHKVFESPNSPDCIRCGNCITRCPVGAVKVSNAFSVWKLKPEKETKLV